MAQALYREWFVHFRFPGHEDVPLVESDLGPIPSGWEVALLREIARVNELSIRKTAPEEIQYVDISSVSTGQIDEIDRASGFQTHQGVRVVLFNMETQFGPPFALIGVRMR